MTVHTCTAAEPDVEACAGCQAVLRANEHVSWSPRPIPDSVPVTDPRRDRMARMRARLDNPRRTRGRKSGDPREDRRRAR